MRSLVSPTCQRKAPGDQVAFVGENIAQLTGRQLDERLGDALVQVTSPCVAQLTIDHLAHQVMAEGVSAAARFDNQGGAPQFIQRLNERFLRRVFNLA